MALELLLKVFFCFLILCASAGGLHNIPSKKISYLPVQISCQRYHCAGEKHRGNGTSQVF